MNRKEFLHKLGVISGGMAFGMNGIIGRAYAHNPMMANLADTKGNILVIIQLSGGNDGMNTVIPYENPIYYQKRPNIAIAKESVLALNTEIGLHPSLGLFKNMYDEGKLAVVQNVGYENPNRSHFRSTDIWISASNANDVIYDGWIGRYLHQRYADYPIKLPINPMAIQLGSAESPLFTSEIGSMGLTLQDPNQFFQLTRGSTTDNDPIPATLAGDELKFMNQLAAQSMQYSDVIKAAADKASNLVTYPTTTLGKQLGIIAELIAGGLQTPVYMAQLGGFDTHANQLNAHASLMTQLADAISAFQTDIEKQGLANKVILMTFSEFGRRLNQNASQGTDHGSAAPLFVIGKTVRGGIIGTAPSLKPEDLDSSGDIKYKYDFRQIYSSVLKDHLGLTQTETKDILANNFNTLPIFNTVLTANEPEEILFELIGNYPNPFSAITRIDYRLNKSQRIELCLYDMNGRKLETLRNEIQDAGTYTFELNGESLASGQYLYSLEGEGSRKTKKIIKL